MDSTFAVVSLDWFSASAAIGLSRHQWPQSAGTLGSFIAQRPFATKLLMASMPIRSGQLPLLQARDRLFGSLPADLESAQAITQTGEGNPFLVDGVANVLDHANVGTLLNVYFHGAPLLLADFAFAVTLFSPPRQYGLVKERKWCAIVKSVVGS